LSFLVAPNRVLVGCGQPLLASEVLHEGPDTDDEQMARKLSWHLHRAIDAEEKVVRGPMLKSAAQIRSDMMSDPQFLSRIEEIARSGSMPVKKAKQRAGRCIKEIAADFSSGYIEFLSFILTPIFRRVFSSFVVDRDALNTIREAARETPVVLMPCHRSHIDYLIISYLLHLQGIIPPHIAAGSNLSFFPMGHIFRHCGAFFIRRKTGGDEIYALTLAQYVRKLLKEGYSIEFFAEGGRSRTGKTLPPRFGILGYVADAVCSAAVREVTIVPIALSYERIMEAEGYTQELSGGEKKREDIRGLVKSAQVLDSRYGRLYITAGRPVRVAEFLRNRTGKEVEEISEQERRDLVKTLGYLVLGRINRATVVNPTGLVACALLSHHRRGVSKTQFLENCGFLLEFANKRGYPLSVTIERALLAATPDIARSREKALAEPSSRSEYLARGRAIAPVLNEALDTFASQGYVSTAEFEDETVFSVVPRARSYMNYYRNNLVHVYQREALTAASLLARSHQPGIARSQVEEDVLFLSRLFKKEFIFRVGDFSRGVLAALESWSSEGVIQVSPEHTVLLVPSEVDRLLLFRNMILPVIESYLIAARYAPMVRWKGAMKQKDLVAAILDRSQQDYHQGDLTCQEAVSAVNIANALDRYKSMDLLTTVDNGLDSGRVRLVGPESLEGLRKLEETLSAFVDVRRGPA
jgi:glycerol-3-phosphate O-acyltransferase